MVWALLALLWLAPAASAGRAAPPGIAFNCPQSDGTRQICFVDLDGSVRRLTRGPAHHEGPAWSHGGRRLAYVRSTDVDTQIVVAGADGMNPRDLTTPPGNHHSPVWSPDGNTIAYVEERDGAAQIYVVETDGRSRRRLTGLPWSSFAPAWSPDGRRLALLVQSGSGQPDLFVMNADGTGRRRIRTLTTGMIPGVSAVQWLPDGRSLLYTTRASRAASELWRAPVDRDAPQWFANGYAPGVTQDGRMIAYVVARSGGAEIWVQPLAGGAARRLTDRQWVGLRPAWSPDGQLIAFVGIRPGDDPAVWISRPDGTGLRRLAPTAGNFSILPPLAWRPR